MKKKDLKNLVITGAAIDITDADKRIEESLEIVDSCRGTRGRTGLLLKGLETGNLYAITEPNVNLLYYGR